MTYVFCLVSMNIPLKQTPRAMETNSLHSKDNLPYKFTLFEFPRELIEDSARFVVAFFASQGTGWQWSINTELGNHALGGINMHLSS
jgi:hypothetical protein